MATIPFSDWQGIHSYRAQHVSAEISWLLVNMKHRSVTLGKGEDEHEHAMQTVTPAEDAVRADLGDTAYCVSDQDSLQNAEHVEPLTSTDREAFEALFKAQFPKLQSFIRKHVRTASQAEDIAQQAFLEAYRSWHNFRGDSKPETWLFGIAMNVLRNAVSRQPEYRYVFESAEDSLDTAEADESADPLVSLLRAEMAERIQIAITYLPHAMGEVVKMVVLEGYSYQDAASALQVPVGTIRSRLSRARDALKVLIDG